MDATAIEQAGEAMFDQVYVPAYLQKCASRGVTFQDEDELRTALQSTNLLRVNQVKQAAAANSGLHKSANAALRQLFGEDVEATEKASQDDQVVQSFVQQASQNENVLKAAALLSSLDDTDE